MSIAHVFNGFKDMVLMYDGKPYRFPFGEVTKLADQTFTAPDEVTRNHQSNPVDGAIFKHTVEAIKFATDLLNRHYQGLGHEGVVWIGDHMPSKAEQEATLELGKMKKIEIVEQALADRREALANKGRPSLDPQIVLWMKEYGVTDPIYNKADAGLSKEDLERIGAIAGAVMANVNKPEPVAAKR